jgi:hypothetical protein
MHLTNLQIILALFLASDLAEYVIGQRHGRWS